MSTRTVNVKSPRVKHLSAGVEAPPREHRSRRIGFLKGILVLAGEIPSVAYMVALCQVALWFESPPKFVFMKSWSSGKSIGSLLLELLTTFILFSLLRVVAGRRYGLGTVLRFALVGVYIVLLFFRLNAGTSLDFYLLAENVTILFYRESLAMLVSTITAEHWLIFLNACLLIIVVDLFIRPRSPVSTIPRSRPRLFLLAGALVVILASPAYYHNDLTYVIRTGAEFCVGRFVHPAAGDSAGYPYVQPSLPVEQACAGALRDTPSTAPHVFVIMMESFSNTYVHAKTESGQEITPVFNTLLKEGVFVDRFYGNSVQTCRGQLATLCSILPSTQGKVFTEHPDLRVKSLAHILKSAGYRTCFFKAYRTLKFDNTGPFMRHIGFEEVHAMDSRFVSKEDRKFKWGWGLQDDKFYQKVFDYLDTHPGTDGTRPCFVCLHTVSHHVPFSRMPDALKYLYPHPKDRREHFVNSMFLADKYLAEFFRQLKARPQYANSIVVVTGDHSFPAGEHDSFYNEHGFWEENFRTPLVILWPGHLKPREIRDGAFCQLDIAPTLLELLGISASNHFTGRSIISGSGDRPIHLIQPYSGPYLCVMRYPLKYVRGERNGDEYLFDLKRDPTESHNLIEEFRGNAALQAFDKDVDYITRNQLLIERNRIWPSSGAMDDAVWRSTMTPAQP